MRKRRLIVIACFVLSALLLTTLPAYMQDDPLLVVTSRDQTITISAPPSWYGTDNTSGLLFLLVANRPEVRDLIEAEEPLESGDLFVFIAPPAMSWFLLGTDTPPATLADTMSVFLAATDDSDRELVGDAEATTVGHFPALRQGMDEAYREGAYYLLDVDGTFIVTLIGSASGEFAEHEADLLAILATLTYDPAAALDYIPFISSADSFTFDYPREWLSIEYVPGTVVVTNNPRFVDDFGPGDIAVLISYGDGLLDFGVEPGMSMPDALAAVLTSFGDEDVQTTQPPVALIVGDFPALQTTFYTENVGQGDAYALLIDMDGDYVVVVFVAADGELADYDAEYQRLIESIRFTPASQ